VTSLWRAVEASRCSDDSCVARAATPRCNGFLTGTARNGLAVHLRIPHSSNDGQRPIQILHQIGHIFDPGRETDQSIADARRRALLR
jgi:hypothetical protein